MDKTDEKSIHKTVLLNETIEGLNLSGKNPAVLDGTFGGGGHSELLVQKGAKVIALDVDQSAWQKAKYKFVNYKSQISFVNENFKNLDTALGRAGVDKVDGIVLDLGLSSDQLSPPAGGSGRGFSFMRDEPLLMTMKDIKDNLPRPEDLTAREIVNTWEEGNLAQIIYGYGEERFSRKIARAIVERRQEKEFETTFDLVKVIEGAVPGSYRRGRINPATKTFQAIRIAVNDELGALQEGLKKGFEALKPNGRMAVISFHSLEDRIVKRFFRAKVESGEGKYPPAGGKKPIIAGALEIKENPRSRSAKLRILEKI